MSVNDFERVSLGLLTILLLAIAFMMGTRVGDSLTSQDFNCYLAYKDFATTEADTLYYQIRGCDHPDSLQYSDLRELTQWREER